MEENEKLENLMTNAEKLAREEKVFCCILSYRFSINHLYDELRRFYEEGATLTSWQLHAMHICIPGYMSDILKHVTCVAWTEDFTDVFLKTSSVPITKFFKKFKVMNPEMPYPKVPLGIQLNLVIDRDWDWYINICKENPLWGAELYALEHASKNKDYVQAFISLCKYLLTTNMAAFCVNGLLLFLKTVEANNNLDNKFIEEVSTYLSKYGKNSVWQPLIDYLNK
jgi:hypothetical protein